uniref:Threonine/serine exporter-like N-terminal domain-containing protein n=1 Tax=Solibacter usitatus (strain Ellin6076) TaxID=234267 RepID=Q021I1_SOLUE
MHEIRTTIPPECVAEAARLAHAAGIERVVIAEVFVEGPNEHRRLLSVETSTPQARVFVESFLHSPVLSEAGCTLTSREVRAIVGGGPVSNLTRPMSEPIPDIIQDLWQLSHVTPSYIARAAAGAILLATGILGNDPVAIIAAALFLPFLAQVLALSLGVWSRDRRLVLHGARALATSTVLALGAGAAVAWIQGGPILYAGFRSPLNNFFLSCIIGVTAGLSTADDTGRRYLLAVAAAVQLAIFPVWLGAAAVLGTPAHDILYSRILSFGINLTTITVATLAAYASLHLRSERL